MNFLRVTLLVIISFVLGLGAADFTLNLLHTNDVHARIEQFNKYGGSCPSNTSTDCFGGFARRHTVIESIRGKEENVILLDGGDVYQGTLWQNVYGGLAAVAFMNYSKYDAMALGNHEFDNGVEGLLPFLQNAAFPIVCSNMDVSKEAKWPKGDSLYTKSTVLTRSGKKIGIVGYITTHTAWLSQPGPNIIFSDVIAAVRAEAAALVAKGVDIIVALGHAGIETDLKIAREIADVDIVVGGHSNTFLYNGAQPSNDKIEGPYPKVENRKDGSRAVVVQDFAYGKYLGHLKMVFDDSGKLKSWNGNPILLDSSHAQDRNVLAVVNEMDDKIIALSNKPIGFSLVHLEGDRKVCRAMECNMGNLIADAIVSMNQATPDDDQWATVALGIWNSGGIRASILKNRTEAINQGDIAVVLPFGNTADIVEVKGFVLLEMFEHSVSGVATLEGRFLQVSGFRITYDLSKPLGKRVVRAQALCLKCRIPSYQDIIKDAVYKVILPSYLASGGDNYVMLPKNIMSQHSGEDAMVHLRDYIKRESPITQAVEGRISFSKENTCSSGLQHSLSVLSLILTLALTIWQGYF